jgi:polyisoprenoid-binding protein YceI
VIHRLAVLATTVLVAAAASAEAADWKMDAATSHLEFAAAVEKTVALGVFREFDARMHFDDVKPSEARLDVAIIMKSADMNSADMNKAIGGAEWFDFARFPQAEFHATDISRTDAGRRYLARGTLSVKGAQQPVEVPFSWSEGSDAARLEGEFIVKRGAFGIGTGEWAVTNVIGADVKVKFSVRMRKSG